jgi:hypothetical protein
MKRTLLIAGFAFVAFMSRGLVPELVRYLKIRRL